MENAITPVKDNATANPNGSSNPKGTQLPAHIQTDRGLASVNLFNPTELAAAETLMEKLMRSEKGGIKSVNEGISILLIVSYKIRTREEIERHHGQQNIECALLLLLAAYVCVKQAAVRVGKALSHILDKQRIEGLNAIVATILAQKLCNLRAEIGRKILALELDEYRHATADERKNL